ncbi:uncharacterized protein LOC130548797 [Triplophysa rosa]|uniref:Extensin-like n=1 Tax=Triplophysa rosa TaxID=992332 RepID=A0A9W7W8C7_TRIRA|nr:uncharacterized protein LOC130548797 [Triplophysa rosa]KAI7790951.1 putative extensin-like [Triplophysa rosa]
MKKRPLNFLGRKNRNLFDTNVEIKEIDHVELMLDSAAIPESGTAKVRSRPTVKHFTSNDSLQGFAVPTPKVPLLLPFIEPTVNGTGSPRNLQNGGKLSAYNMSEGELFVPPPPSSAPPPPPPSSVAQRPPSFIPPPPPSHGDRHPFIDTASLQPPAMPPPKPPSHNGSNYRDQLDLASLIPPPMAPPTPPSDKSSFRGSVSSLDYEEIPDCPKFTPPPPPSMGKPPPVLPKTQKMPPLKPIRLSSIPNMDIQSRSPTPPLASTPTLSSFNPQNTAKIYHMPKGTVLTGQVDREKRVQSILLLEDSTGNPVGVHVNGNSGGSLKQVQSVPPVKPARRGSTAAQLENDIPDGAQVQAPSQPTKQEAKINPEPETTTPIHFSPKIEKKPDVGQVKTHVDIPGRSHRYSPVLNHRHLKTRGLESSGKKNETSTSPLALLMASKEREKKKNNLSRQNSGSYEPQTSAIQPNVEKPNSFTVIPRDLSERASVEFKPTINTQPVVPLSTKVDVPNGPYSKSVLSSTPMNSSAGVQHIAVRDEENGEEMLFIPPPPEFANFDPEDEPPAPPPAHPAPAPPLQATPPSFKPSIPPPVTNGPLITPKPKPPTCPPKAPCPPPVIQPKPPVQIKYAPPPVQAPPPASQTTLLSILQRKMLEMDPKFSAVKEADFNDDWNSPLSDDEGPAPFVVSKPLQTRSAAPPARPQGLYMKELENKATKKTQDFSSPSRSSNGPSSKQSFGMTFTVRPGSKQPITPVIKN